MPNIIWPTADEVEIVDAIRGAIGRNVDFHYIETVSGCPVCDYDPVNDASTDAFCTTCSGEYWIPIYESTTLSGHISWGYSEQLGWVTAGQMDDGICRVQIKYSPDNEIIVDKTKWMIVDERTMTIKKKIVRGVQGINRILIDLEEKES